MLYVINTAAILGMNMYIHIQPSIDYILKFSLRGLQDNSNLLLGLSAS